MACCFSPKFLFGKIVLSQQAGSSLGSRIGECVHSVGCAINVGLICVVSLQVRVGLYPSV